MIKRGLLLCFLSLILLGTTPSVRAEPIDAAAQLTVRLKGIIGARKLAVSLIPVSPLHGVAAAGWHSDEPYAVASAFKGPVLIYFLEYADPTIYRSVPPRYWGEKNPEKLPAEFRGAWQTHQKLLYDLYQMAVLSENDSTGRVLNYVYRMTPATTLGDNPLRAFNTWSQTRVGVGAESGMRAWQVGESICPRCFDDRFTGHTMIYAKKVHYLNNTYTATDLAKYWVYLATEGRRLGYFQIAADLMSNQKYGLVNKVSKTYGVRVVSKDGYIAPGSEYGIGYRISTDAGLLQLPSGEEYAVAFLAFDSGDLIEPSAHALNQVIAAFMRAEF
jgi:hypothetical protein